MPPPRVPSLELLRTLRRTAQSHTHRSVNQLCPNRRPFHNSAARAFTSSRSLLANEPQLKAATYPPSTTPSPTGETLADNRHNRFAPKTHDRGPTSKEDTQTDFGAMDIYANIPNAATAIDACTSDGFHLDNGLKITGYAGLLVAGGEAWCWRPWLALSQSQPQAEPATRPETTSADISVLLEPKRGILTIPKQSLGLFGLLHPKPDLLIIGTGSKLWMLAPESKKYIMEELGIRVDVMDTANASAAYNLLAKERGVDGGAGVGGAFLPIGWKGPEVVRRRRK